MERWGLRGSQDAHVFKLEFTPDRFLLLDSGITGMCVHTHEWEHVHTHTCRRPNSDFKAVTEGIFFFEKKIYVMLQKIYNSYLHHFYIIKM